MMGNLLGFCLFGGMWPAWATPLCSSFPLLFSFCGNSEITIYHLAYFGCHLAFRCSLSHADLEQWHQLASTFPSLSETSDSVVYPHSSSGCFIGEVALPQAHFGVYYSEVQGCLEGLCSA